MNKIEEEIQNIQNKIIVYCMHTVSDELDYTPPEVQNLEDKSEKIQEDFNIIIYDNNVTKLEFQDNDLVAWKFHEPEIKEEHENTVDVNLEGEIEPLDERVDSIHEDLFQEWLN